MHTLMSRRIIRGCFDICRFTAGNPKQNLITKYIPITMLKSRGKTSEVREQVQILNFLVLQWQEVTKMHANFVGRSSQGSKQSQTEKIVKVNETQVVF